jgi:hypothetical protein
MRSNRYIILLAVLLLSVTTAGAQYNPYWKWAKADTTNPKTIPGAGSVLAAKNGKAMWGRMTVIKTTFNGVPWGNYMLSEIDSNGVQGSATVMGGKMQLLDAQVDANGDWYILGRYYDSVIFSSSPLGLFRPNPATNTDPDHFVAAFYGGSMVLKWIKPIGLTNIYSSRAFTIANNNIYIAVDSGDATLVRTMSLTTGNYTPLITQRGGNVSTSIQVDATGNVFLAGTCSAKGIDFNGTMQPATGPDNYSYIVKYTAAGSHAWHIWTRDPTCSPRKLTLYKNQFLYYTGNVRDTLTFGPTYFRHPANTYDYINARLDVNNGNVLWAHQMDTSSSANADLGDPYHAVVTPDTALVMFAQGNEYVNWGDFTYTNFPGMYASAAVSTGSDGHIRWVRTIMAENTSNQHIATENIDVWLTGNAYSTTNKVLMDTLGLTVPPRKFIPYLAKLRMVRPIPQNGVGGYSTADISVYPNPAHSVIYITGLQPQVGITLTDVSGRILRQYTTPSGISKAELDVQDLPRGAYFVELKGEGGKTVKKILVN